MSTGQCAYHTLDSSEATIISKIIHMSYIHKTPFHMNKQSTTIRRQTLTPRSSWPSQVGTWGGGPCCASHKTDEMGNQPGTTSGLPCHLHCLWCCSGSQCHCCLCCVSMCLPANHKSTVVHFNHSQKTKHVSYIYISMYMRVERLIILFANIYRVKES